MGRESLGELELAYATTIHKSQGSEYDTVIVPMLPAHRILSPVALSAFLVAVELARGLRSFASANTRASKMAMASVTRRAFSTYGRQGRIEKCQLNLGRRTKKCAAVPYLF